MDEEFNLEETIICSHADVKDETRVPTIKEIGVTFETVEQDDGKYVNEVVIKRMAKSSEFLDIGSKSFVKSIPSLFGKTTIQAPTEMDRKSS